MTKNEFIFSNRHQHRIVRHTAFWIAWLLAYLLFFHYPVHSLRGWNLSETSDTFQSIGLTNFIIKTLIFNALLPVVLPQIAFTYVLLYYLLPNYVYKKRNLFAAVGIVATVFMVYYFISVVFKIIPWYQNYLAGRVKSFPGFNPFMYAAIRDILTTLPIVVGFALMIKLIKRWWFKQKETEQLAAEKIRAELQLLKAQIHPHFLFNTLNNIYFFSLKGSPKAPEMIKKLSSMLNYILNECNQPMVPLRKEIKMVRDYMALEEMRYGEQMKMTIEIQDEFADKMIAPLLLIPFVENSFKHGTSKMIAYPWLNIRLNIENNLLHFILMNSCPQSNEPVSVKGNIGLKNVKKRLEILYPSAHELIIEEQSESFTVYLKIQLKEIASGAADNKEIKPIAKYAMA